MDTVQSATGSIRGEIAGNSVMRLSPSLALFIDAKTERDNELSLEWHGPDVHHWRDLERRRFSFPVEPVTGYVDGDEIEMGPRVVGLLRIDGVARAIRAVSIEFGAICDGFIQADLSLKGRLPEAFDIDCTLRIGEIRVLGDVAKVHPPSRNAALVLAGTIIDLERFAVDSSGRILVLHPNFGVPH